MNIYKIHRYNESIGYDEFDSAVVVAESEDIARTIDPSTGEPFPPDDGTDENLLWKYDHWTRPENVKVVLVGTAVEGAVRGLICASFNAG